jgi:cell division protease FtsH
MGDAIVSHAVTKGSIRGAQPVETGADRNMWDGEFGARIESRLRDLHDRTWDLLEDNRAEVLGVAHALETRKTITGDDVAAVVEGSVGPTVDGRPYQDAAFRQMLENYHVAVLRAHKEHSGVEGSIPVPVPPPPVEVAPTPAPPMPGSRPRLVDPTDPSDPSDPSGGR